jgi:hypothetical protein
MFFGRNIFYNALCIWIASPLKLLVMMEMWIASLILLAYNDERILTVIKVAQQLTAPYNMHNCRRCCFGLNPKNAAGMPLR